LLTISIFAGAGYAGQVALVGHFQHNGGGMGNFGTADEPQVKPIKFVPAIPDEIDTSGQFFESSYYLF
jgi:hypothetical protein